MYFCMARDVKYIKINYKISFSERAAQGKVILSKQSKPTLAIIRNQVAKLKMQSQVGQKKKGH